MALPNNKKPLTRLEALHTFAFSSDLRTLVWRHDLHPKTGCKAGQPCGCVQQNGYIRIGYKGTTYSAHRLSFLLAYGFWPEWNLDHIDNNKLNNSPHNLRPCQKPGTGDKNKQNQHKPLSTNKTTGVLGVCIPKGRQHRPHKYLASIVLDGKSKGLGYFKTAEEAHQAYITAKRKYHEFNTL